MMIYNKWMNLRKTTKSTVTFKIQMFDYLILGWFPRFTSQKKGLAAQTRHYYTISLKRG